MPKGDNLIGKGGKKFSKENQPSSATKKAGWVKRNALVKTLKDIKDYIENTKGSTVGDNELSILATLFHKQIEKAKKGDTKAFQAVMPFIAPTKTAQTNTDGKDIDLHNHDKVIKIRLNIKGEN